MPDTTAIHHSPAVQPLDSAALGPYQPLDTATLQLWAAHAPADSAARAVALMPVVVPPPPGREAGLAPRPRPSYGIADESMTAVIVAILMAVIMALRHGRHLISSVGAELLTIRPYIKNFDERTSGESRLMALAIVQLAVFIGLLLQSFADSTPASAVNAPPIAVAAIFTALSAGLIIFQYSAYWTVAYAFAADTQRHMWLRSFNACQILISFALAIPALAAISYPDSAHAMVITALIAYIALKTIFMYKGFRIFYNNLISLIYFILYLCALEIVPAVLLIHFTTDIARSIQL